ncbi:MAG: LamG-like jellyroll fold domain-containing protein, partial [Candidatus Thorarchaeota archaeon]
MRKPLVIAFLVCILFMVPSVQNPQMIPFSSDGFSPVNDGAELADGSQALGSGTGRAIDTLIHGTIENGTESPVQIDSTSSALGTIGISGSGDYTSTGLDATIDSLSMTVTDALRNPDWNDYHEEKMLYGDSSDWYEDVAVPDGWTLVKNEADENAHPHHGDWEINDGSSGYGGSRGFRYEAYLDSSSDPSDEAYFSQLVNVPWREIYSVEIKFRYYVISGYNKTDQVFLFLRFAGNERTFNVFESGQPTGSWQQKTVTLSSSALDTVTLPDALLFDIGMATDSSGQSPILQVRAYIDEIELSMNVRPFPEQVGLMVNGTAVVGSTSGSVFPYLPDENGRDCTDPTGGIDLDGYNNVGTPEVGVWGSGWSTTNAYEVGLQFPLDIPQGAVIERAYVETESAGVSNIVDMRVLVSIENSVGQPVDSFSNYIGLHLEDSYNWLPTSIDWRPDYWTQDTRYASPDIAPLIQKAVSDQDWASGQYIAVMLAFMNSGSFQAYNKIKGSADSHYAANELSRLYVWYRLPHSDDAVKADVGEKRSSLQYKKDITIDYTQVSEDLTDFPVLIDIYDTDLRTDVRPDGADISFMVGNEFVEHEIEMFQHDHNGTHARLVAWVKVPSLSSSVDTIITMLYGSRSATDLESSGVWDDYEMVQHMNDYPNGTTHDSSLNLHSGPSYGSMSYTDLVAGAIGNATNFDGVDDVISVGQIDTDDWTSFSVTAWVYHDVTGDDRIFSKAPTTTTTEAIIHTAINGGDQFTIRMFTDGVGGGASGSRSASTLINPGSWYQVAWSWSASTEFIRLYLNGNFENQVAWDGDTVEDSFVPFMIANWQTGTGNNRFLDGKVDELRLTTHVLTDGWIATEFANQDDPSSFYSVGIEQSTTPVSAAKFASLRFTADSPVPVIIGFTMAMDFEGIGKSLDENFNEGTSFHAVNGTNVVDWTAKVLVSPPPGVTQSEVYVSYPMTEWRPISVTNPIGQSKTNPTDWTYTGGTLTLLPTGIDVYGVWTIGFEGFNYLSDLELGVDGGPLSSTGDFQTNHTMRFEGTSMWYAGSASQLYLTDPTGSKWSTPVTNNTVGSPTHEIPSFQYSKIITIDHNKVSADLANFPFLLDITDADVDSRAQADGDDILFVQNGIILAHELEEYSVGGGSAHIVAWIRANLSGSVDTDITMYYGNSLVGPQERPADVWGDDYVGVYHLEESPTGTSGEITDSTYYGNDGTTEGSMNSADLVDAKFGKGLDFDEVDDLIRISDSASLDTVATAGTIQLWIWWDNAADGQWQVIMESSNRFNGNPNDGFEWAVQNDGDHYFYPWAGDGSNFNMAPNPFTNQQWHHVAITLDYSTRSVKTYIDGSEDPPVVPNVLTFWTQIADLDDWLWGGDPEQPLRYFDGMFDEIRIATVERSSAWLYTEYQNQNDPTIFYNNIGLEQTGLTYTPSFVNALDSTAAAGIWTATALFNDSGSAVDYSVGIYERDFIVKHDTSLALQEPSDAVGDRLTVTTAGEWIYVEYELTDDITALGVPGVTVTMNWTASGAPTQVTLDDFGTGTYGKMLNTDDLGTAKRWRVDLLASHPFYNDDTEYFNLDLYHETNLDYGDVTTTPADFDFTATLLFTDSYDGSPIEGAEITLDGSPVAHDDLGLGHYNVSIPTGALSLGDHSYIFNATLSGSYLEMASVSITFTLRQHFTSVNVQGDLVQPYGFNTQLNVILLDLDTGSPVPLSAVSQFSFDPASYGVQNRPGTTYSIALATDTWDVALESVTLTISITDTKYATPQPYLFEITIRSRFTSVSVSGSLVQPYGNMTPLNVYLWDHDAEEIVPVGIVDGLIFTHSYGSDPFLNPSSYDVVIDTSTWNVGITTVTLIVNIVSDIYLGPTNFVFDITIRSRSTVLYHDPSDLVFPEFGDFWIDLRVNVSEAGTSYGQPVAGLTQGEFSLSGNPYPFTIDTTDNLIGRYRLTILYTDLGGGSS